MSARFGRNKRRAAREALAQAQNELNRQAVLAQSARSELNHHRAGVRHLTDTFAALASMVARHSVFAGEPTLLNKGDCWHPYAGDRINMALVEPLDFTELSNMQMTSVIQQEVLRLMEVKTVRDFMTGVIHAHVHVAGVGKAYGISEKALQRMSMSELAYFLEREIAPQLAQALAKDLKKVYR